MRNSFRVSMFLAALLSAPLASAHILENMGYREFPDPLPAFSESTVMADEKIQRMAVDIGNTPCEELQTIPAELQGPFLISQLFLQRPGALSKMIGPECGFLGNAVEVAKVTDPLLTISEGEESLYYLEDQHTLVVTNTTDDTIAYGMFYHGDDPLQYFLENRDSAERSALVARGFREAVGSVELPEEYSVSTASTASQALQFASSASSDASTLFNQPENIQVTSAASALSAVSGTPVLGPEPQQPVQQRSGFPWLMLLFFLVAGGVLVFVYLKTRSTPKQGYRDE